MHWENIKDKNQRKEYKKNELSRRSLKALYNNHYINNDIRASLGILLHKKPGRSSEIRNRCVLTGRGRGVLRKFKISRLSFKKLSSQGLIIGIKKSSW